MTDAIRVVPANCASCDDLRAVFGARGTAAKCQCQRFKTPPRQWDAEWGPRLVEERALRLREQTNCGQPRARTTSGLVAYLDGEPVGWCAVEPRTAYVRLGSTPRGRSPRGQDATVSGR